MGKQGWPQAATRWPQVQAGPPPGLATWAPVCAVPSAICGRFLPVETSSVTLLASHS